jgi:hypothetical protein
MPGALVDLQVAARLAAREARRRLRGDREPVPDVGRFREAFDRAIAALPPGTVAERRWIELPADEPPWRDTGIALRAGEAVSWFAVGRVVVSSLLDVFVTPRTQLWGRIGEKGPIRSSSRDSNTLRAEVDGRLYFGNYFPNDWRDESGARLQDDRVYAGVGGGITVCVLRWAGRAEDGLDALVAAGDPMGLATSERERLARGDPAPPGWHYLWHLGQAEIFRTEELAPGERCLRCEVEGDVGILQKDVAFALRPGTGIAWRWRVDALPGLVREDSVPSHDYLSLAVEFASGLDLTYFWSCELPVGTAFWCPLPNWSRREFHVVVRSGETGLGVWQEEHRNLYDDALRYLGTHPGDVVRVWLIAVSVFKRQPGRCRFAGIRLSSGEDVRQVL